MRSLWRQRWAPWEEAPRSTFCPGHQVEGGRWGVSASVGSQVGTGNWLIHWGYQNCKFGLLGEEDWCLGWAFAVRELDGASLRSGEILGGFFEVQWEMVNAKIKCVTNIVPCFKGLHWMNYTKTYPGHMVLQTVWFTRNNKMAWKWDTVFKLYTNETLISQSSQTAFITLWKIPIGDNLRSYKLFFLAPASIGNQWGGSSWEQAVRVNRAKRRSWEIFHQVASAGGTMFPDPTLGKSKEGGCVRSQVCHGGRGLLAEVYAVILWPHIISETQSIRWEVLGDLKAESLVYWRIIWKEVHTMGNVGAVIVGPGLCDMLGRVLSEGKLLFGSLW